MTQRFRPDRRAAGAGLLAAAAAVSVSRSATAAECVADEKARAFAVLPDWTGIWMGRGNVLDQSRGVQSTNNPNARDYPPYKPEWERAYREFLDNVVKQDKFVDPLTIGYPGGIMRMMSPARGLQFVLRPEQVWIIYERPDVRYIYTDGRPFPPKDELWPTFEGYSIGHWEEDTLVVDTTAIMPQAYIAISEAVGIPNNGDMHVVERMHLADEVGHVRWDKDIINLVWPKTSPAIRWFNAKILGWMMGEYFSTPKRATRRVRDCRGCPHVD